MLEITVANEIGFCFGVDKAVKITEEFLNKGENVYVTGDLIHNEEEMRKLERMGLRTLKLDSEWPDLSSSVVIVRAHGIPVDQMKKLLSKAKRVVNATCPVVSSVADSIKKAHDDGFEILLYGHEHHDEVTYLTSIVNGIKVFDSPDKISYSTKKIAIFSQTTMDMNGFKEVVKQISENMDELSIVMVENTICKVTYQREREVEELARSRDVCLVVGGSKSSNTKKLFNIAKNLNERTYLILNADDLRTEWFKSVKSVGICSGTSTPRRIVDEIVEKLRTF
ncbi:4-hydroxy-3-methylbut-2-enyl diphosphate reductase [Athalassotoga saccharophila]|uniref:4-hydroxy-3-methylbut-2-enyl diphosphate reductase n=1 Tax=Athalassotoga saccharophila TaxID=1441386 RepID=UPI00137B29A7|nr:4-hydroxy-3-methylbut-2-enyl diphosphate reductase [Athalassotoga saccharophila]BBJ28458.1 4-hydroxy-3-methylbut-2-enyl diphosphate reductase [Athalassotoga saccharophila]